MQRFAGQRIRYVGDHGYAFHQLENRWLAFNQAQAETVHRSGLGAPVVIKQGRQGQQQGHADAGKAWKSAVPSESQSASKRKSADGCQLPRR